MDLERARKQDVEGRVYETLGRAKEIQACLNAAVTFVDPKEQLKELEAISAGVTMYDMPVVSKDNVNTKEIRITASPRILDNYISVYNVRIVDKPQAIDAAVIAKADMGELGMGGTSRNAYTGPVSSTWDENRISRGSGGGSAALVAAGVVPFAIGTDTGNSVRKPVTYQGIIGTKPTYGGISRYSIILYASNLDYVGYFTTSVQDAAVTLEVLVDCDDRDMASSNRAVEACTASLNHDLHGKRITVLDSVQKAVADPAIRRSFDTSMKELETRSAIATHVRIDDKLMKALVPIYYITMNAEAIANHSNLDGIRFGMRETGKNVEDVMINTRTKGFCSYVHKRFVIGSYSLFAENQDKIFRKAQKVRRLIMEELNHVPANNDVVITSVIGTTTPLAGESKDSHLGADNNVTENHMVLGNLSGYPNMIMLTSFTEGMPIDINITAKVSDEQTSFNIGLAIEEETGLKGNDVEVDAWNTKQS